MVFYAVLIIYASLAIIQPLAILYLVIWNCKPPVGQWPKGDDNSRFAKDRRNNEVFFTVLAVWTLVSDYYRPWTSDRFTPFRQQSPCFR